MDLVDTLKLLGTERARATHDRPLVTLGPIDGWDGDGPLAPIRHFPMRAYVQLAKDCGSAHALIIIVATNRSTNEEGYSDLLSLLDVVGHVLGKTTPATPDELRNFYAAYGASRDEELLHWWSVLCLPGGDW